MQNSSTAKRELSEYGIHNTHLQDEINVLQREKDQSTSLISTLQQRVKTFVCCRYYQIYSFSLQMKKI